MKFREVPLTPLLVWSNPVGDYSYPGGCRAGGCLLLGGWWAEDSEKLYDWSDPASDQVTLQTNTQHFALKYSAQ